MARHRNGVFCDSHPGLCRTGVMVLALLLLHTPNAMSCPACVVRSLQSVWPLVAAVEIGAAIALSFKKLDWLRVFYVFLGYEILWLKGCESLYLHSDLIVGSRSATGIAAELALRFLSLGIFEAAMLYGMGYLAFFRKPSCSALPIWRACLLIPITIATHFCIL